MGKNKEVGVFNRGEESTLWTLLRLAVYVVASVILSILSLRLIGLTTSIASDQTRRLFYFTANIGLLIIHGLLSLTLQRTLASLSPNIGKGWSNRLGFLLSICLAIIQVTIIQQEGSFSSDLLTLTFASSGALLGGLLTTGLDDGLLEHNVLPSDLVRLDVLERHLQVIGKPHRKLTAKRLVDLCLSTLGLIVSAPVWIMISLLIWFEDPGPILFIKNSAGLGGENFHQLKFRTMVRGAESETGPILAIENDERILLVGHILRKTALDELPQLYNILRGDMSFVGPRPQRTVLVRDYLEETPEFAERHRIRPGLAGLAQLVGSYYITPRQKLRFDRIYARHASLMFDLKLILLSFMLVFWLRWRKNWNGRMPRKWLRLGSRRHKITPITPE